MTPADDDARLNARPLRQAQSVADRSGGTPWRVATIGDARALLVRQRLFGALDPDDIENLERRIVAASDGATTIDDERRRAAARASAIARAESSPRD